jgi:hypothetical protein
MRSSPLRACEPLATGSAAFTIVRSTAAAMKPHGGAGSGSTLKDHSSPPNGTKWRNGPLSSRGFFSSGEFGRIVLPELDGKLARLPPPFCTNAVKSPPTKKSPSAANCVLTDRADDC